MVAGPRGDSWKFCGNHPKPLLERHGIFKPYYTMKTFATEEDLSATLDFAEELIRDCVNGQITFNAFLIKYDSFYMRFALDGHESDANERALFGKYSPRIAFHKAIWDEIESKITANEVVLQSKRNASKFISRKEGFELLKKLAAKYLAKVQGI
jgi:hypothetical protein